MIGNYKIVTLCGSTKFKKEFLEIQKTVVLKAAFFFVWKKKTSVSKKGCAQKLLPDKKTIVKKYGMTCKVCCSCANCF